MINAVRIVATGYAIHERFRCNSVDRSSLIFRVGAFEYSSVVHMVKLNEVFSSEADRRSEK